MLNKTLNIKKTWEVKVRFLGYRSELVFRDGKAKRVIKRNP
jgi:hypothetical protein